MKFLFTLLNLSILPTLGYPQSSIGMRVEPNITQSQVEGVVEKDNTTNGTLVRGSIGLVIDFHLTPRFAISTLVF